jgi:hypothetical protein
MMRSSSSVGSGWVWRRTALLDDGASQVFCQPLAVLVLVHDP